MKKLIKKYNNKNTILVISSYPDKKEGIKNLNAVAWYCQNLFKHIVANNSQQFVVLAEKIDKKHHQIKLAKDGQITIIRCWQKNSPFLFKELINWLKKFDQVQIVNIQFEFSMFGGLLTTVLLLPFLLIIKSLRKRIVFTLHHVVLDVNTLSGHLNLKRGGLLANFFNFSLGLFYKILGFLVDKIIVLDCELRERLSLFVAQEKISVVPIGIEEKAKLTSKQEARKKLGIAKNDFVLLYFGFLTWYKGIDWLIKQKMGKNTKLIIAGGESPTLKNKPHYRRFYENVSRLSKESNNIILTGFVQDKEIPLYFNACDLVVLPYRTMISSSGPLSWALSFKKPFLLSKALKNYFHSQDFNQSLKESGLKKSDLLFNLRGNSLRKKIESLNEAKLSRMTKFSSILAKKRNNHFLASLYWQELVAGTEKSHQLSEKLVSQPAYV